MPTVIIDNREPKEIVRELIKKEIKVEQKQLITADYILETKDYNNNTHTIGIEKKTLNDFLNSIIDKRLITQLITLKENFSIPILIIEGSENIYKIRNFNPNSIRGMLASIAIDFQIPILYTQNYRDTASLIAIMAKRLEKPRKNISLLQKKKPLTVKEQQEYIIESLPGIGPSLSKELLKKFKTIKRIINAKESSLKKVKLIGPKKISKIKEVIEEEYKI